MEKEERRSLFNDPNVAELLEILKAAKADVPLGEYTEILRAVDAAEKKLNSIVNELTIVKRQLDEIKDKQHPAQVALTKMVHNLKNKISETRKRLDSLKQSIVSGAKKAVSALKQGGLSALNKVLDAMFKGLKNELNVTKTAMRRHIEFAEKSISRIDAMAGEIHEVGAHARNVGRAARGKELALKRENGKLARAVSAPFRAFRDLSARVEKSVSAAIAKIERREEERRPSVLQTMKDYKEKSNQSGKNVPDRPKNRDASL